MKKIEGIRLKNLESEEELEAKTAKALMAPLEESARKLVYLLWEKIDGKEYDSVLGDDAKGRIHTLLLGNILKEMYQDEKHLEIVFVQGGTLLKGSEEHSSEVEAYLERMRDKIGKRTLIVTEEIAGGVSVEKLALILKKLGIEADVATFGAIGSTSDYGGNPFTTSGGVRIYNGKGRGNIFPDEYSGLWGRAHSGKGHAVAKAPGKISESARRKMRAIRQAEESLAHEIAQEYLAAQKK